jgi:hypothetical protein
MRIALLAKDTQNNESNTIILQRKNRKKNVWTFVEDRGGKRINSLCFRRDLPLASSINSTCKISFAVFLTRYEVLSLCCLECFVNIIW